MEVLHSVLAKENNSIGYIYGIRNGTKSAKYQLFQFHLCCVRPKLFACIRLQKCRPCVDANLNQILLLLSRFPRKFLWTSMSFFEKNDRNQGTLVLKAPVRHCSDETCKRQRNLSEAVLTMTPFPISAYASFSSAADISTFTRNAILRRPSTCRGGY